jgi:hypothetical protein
MRQVDASDASDQEKPDGGYLKLESSITDGQYGVKNNRRRTLSDLRKVPQDRPWPELSRGADLLGTEFEVRCYTNRTNLSPTRAP